MLRFIKYPYSVEVLRVEIISESSLLRYLMSINARELCPNCIDLTEVMVEKRIVREDEICFVEKVIRYCLSCNHELASTVTLKFKHRMG